MSTFGGRYTQSTREEQTYTFDFTNDIPTGGTLTAGTAVHTPPSGSAATLTISVTSPYAYVTLPASQTAGVHYIDAIGTTSDGDAPVVRIEVDVVYPSPTARSGMSDIITELRMRASAEGNEYSLAGVQYWTDAQLQTVLDKHRTDVVFNELIANPYQITSDLEYKEYRSNYGNFEQTTGGTAIFYLQDSTGATVSSALYSADYLRGVFTFATDQNGATYYVTGRSYDINAAAATVWRNKASHYFSAVNFSTDGHNVSRESVYKHCLEMAQYYEGLGESGVTTTRLYRSDTDAD